MISVVNSYLSVGQKIKSKELQPGMIFCHVGDDHKYKTVLDGITHIYSVRLDCAYTTHKGNDLVEFHGYAEFTEEEFELAKARRTMFNDFDPEH